MFSAERAGFEPANGFRPLQTFQVCLFSHSSIFPFFGALGASDYAFQACLLLRYQPINQTLVFRSIVICGYIAQITIFVRGTLFAFPHICFVKLCTFNHICKFWTDFLMESRSESSSTIESNALSLKFGQDSTPIRSARRYTRLNSLALSLVVVGIESGIIVSNRHPHPGHSFVRRHHSGPVRRRQQSFMFEHIFDFT